ncbi:MAG: alkaline phosphatase family protein [Candidatus Sericytochromatia bacterium]
MLKKFLLLSLLVILSSSTVFAKDFTKHVVIISVDGLRPDVLLNTKTPNLNNEWKKGTYSFTAQTIVPSLTLPSHTSMLTGAKFEKHKISWNDYNPNKKLEVKTIFEYAKENNMTTALFVAKNKFKQLDRKNNEFDKFYCPDNALTMFSFQNVLDTAEKYLLEKKPNITFVHLAEIDSHGHVFGWNSWIQQGMLEKMDKPLTNFMEKINKEIDDSVIIFTSDHGGHFLMHGTNDPIDTTIPWFAVGKNINKNKKIERTINTYDTTATALWLLGIEQKEIDGIPVKEIIE